MRARLGCIVAFMVLSVGLALAAEKQIIRPPGTKPDGALFQRMNAVYTKYFQDPRPTRTTVVVAKLVGDGKIEITATARK